MHDGKRMDENFGAVVFPLKLVRSGTIVVHTDASWPEKQRRSSGQAELALNDIIDLAHKRGATLVIASEPPARPSSIPILHVKDTFEALIALARFARSRFKGRVVAVTGTAGKSSTRDILLQLLARIGNTYVSYGNWNSDAGIAMCVASLPSNGNYAVVEVGGGGLANSRPRLLDFVRHDDAIITTIGINDTSKFRTPAVTAQANSKLFHTLPSSGCAYWPQNIAEMDILRAAADGRRIRVVGNPSLSTIAVEQVDCRLDGMRLKISTEDYSTEVDTQIIGSGPLTNFALAAQYAYDQGIPAETIAQVVENFSLYKRKMEMVRLNIAGRSVVLLDDCHNASLVSFKNVLSHVGKFKDSGRRRIFIIGRIAHIEGSEKKIYQELARMIRDCEPFAVILHDVGLDLLAKKLAGKVPILLARVPNDAVALVETLVDDDSLILLKGSHRDTRIWELSKILRQRGASEKPKVATKVSEGASVSASVAVDAVSHAHRITRRVVGDLSIGILGDTYLGEYYASKMAPSRRQHPLHDGDYDAAFEHMDAFLHGNDLNIANLETALTTAAVSPFARMRPFPHWARPAETLNCLSRHNIDAVTLANNHLYDYGQSGVLETLDACDASPLVAIGAGRNVSDAARPLAIDASLRAPDGKVDVERRVLVFNGFAYRKVVDKRFAAYARDNHPGCFPLRGTALVDAIAHARTLDDQAMILVIPHWQRDYQWASRRQRDFAAAVIEAGADLVIGHGAHMLQQVERFGKRVAAHGVGNFVFNAPGRYKSLFAPPYSAAIRLIFPQGSADAPILRLYPFLCDNRATGYRPRFLTEVEAAEFSANYVHLGFIPPDARSASDAIGNFLELRLE